MTPAEIAEEAIKMMNLKITNEIFLIIQNDKRLMYEYLKAVEETGNFQHVNQTIGKTVKSAYQLTNLDDREDNPTCTLIQSHQQYK